MPPAKRVDSPEGRVPQPPGGPAAPGTTSSFDVELPSGGPLTLNTADEVVMWNETRDRYVKDYKLVKQNDLMALGAILSMALMQYRAQRDLSDPRKAATALAMIEKCSEGIRKGEKALGIDKATREKGGQHTVSDYLTTLKRAAYMKGVHLSERTKNYERVIMECRWKLRLLRNGDIEDKAYHNLSPQNICDWLEKELIKLEDLDKKWAAEKGALFVGKL